MRDVVIPGALQDAMSRQAQAEREKQARIILGQAELEIAASFAEAAKSYHDNPTALHLRAMNMLYEGLKEKGALMLIPSSAVESMGMGGLMGAAALRQQRLTERRNRIGFQGFQRVPRVPKASFCCGSKVENSWNSDRTMPLERLEPVGPSGTFSS